MEQNRNEPSQSPPLVAPQKKRRRRLIIWLCADVVVAITVLFLLFHTPAGYTPNTEITNQGPRQYIPRYWSYLGTEIFNRSQLGVPFDLVINQDLLNEAIQQGTWPQSSENVKLYAPTAQLTPGQMQLLGTAEVSGAEMVLTIQVDAEIDPNGQANLAISTVKIGAMNITLLAKYVARQAYQKQLQMMMVDKDRIETKLISALLDDQPFDPVFQVRNFDRRVATVRVTAIDIQAKKIIARLTPKE